MLKRILGAFGDKGTVLWDKGTVLLSHFRLTLRGQGDGSVVPSVGEGLDPP